MVRARGGWAAVVSRMAMVVGSLLGSGCDGLEANPEQDGWLLLATLDTHHFCDMDPVVEVRVRAHWQACAATEPGCEPPEATVIDGDRYTCPATDAHYDLGVMLTRPGRYRVEAVAELTTGQEQPECFVDPESEAAGDVAIELPRTRLEGPSPVVLAEHGPCP